MCTLLCRSDQPSDWLRVLEHLPLCALKRIALSHSNQHFYLVFCPAAAAPELAHQTQSRALDDAVAEALEDFSTLTILNVLVGNLEKCGKFLGRLMGAQQEYTVLSTVLHSSRDVLSPECTYLLILS